MSEEKMHGTFNYQAGENQLEVGGVTVLPVTRTQCVGSRLTSHAASDWDFLASQPGMN